MLTYLPMFRFIGKIYRSNFNHIDQICDHQVAIYETGPKESCVEKRSANFNGWLITAIVECTTGAHGEAVYHIVPPLLIREFMRSSPQESLSGLAKNPVTFSDVDRAFHEAFSGCAREIVRMTDARMDESAHPHLYVRSRFPGASDAEE